MQNEPGSTHRVSKNANTFGLIPSPKANGDYQSFKKPEREIEFQNVEEEISPSSRARRNPWNSATFDNDDFYTSFSRA